MPIPFVLGAIAAVAGVAGTAGGIRGAAKMKEANDTMKAAQSRHERNQKRFGEEQKATVAKMDSLGKTEMEILSSFKEFSEVFSRIHNKPEFTDYKIGDVKIPKYEEEDLKKVSTGAAVLLGGISGAAVGAAGGFAAAGATTAAVMALGTASTGTAIASLSGVAATNATLAALGGGAIAAGGGGMALGTAVLGGATLGIGLLVGGLIFNATGSKLSEKADEAWSQAQKAEESIDKVCVYFQKLRTAAAKYEAELNKVNKIYVTHFNAFKYNVSVAKKDDWNQFTEEEKLLTKNTVLLVSLLYEMCRVQIDSSTKEEYKVNEKKVDDSIMAAETVLREKDLNNVA